MGIKIIAKIRNEEIRARAVVANISERTRGARLRWSDVIRKYVQEKKIEKAQDRKTRRLKTRSADPK